MNSEHTVVVLPHEHEIALKKELNHPAATPKVMVH